MKLRFSARARREASRVDERWRANADYRELFVDELDAPLERLRRDPSLGARYDVEDDSQSSDRRWPPARDEKCRFRH